ncbi:MAG TPA: hypothetical protein VNB24_10310 [Acidimicrobiales bacterium]|nr:hypothetical protein [Acidimicrobiales bacterium]
MVLWYAAPAILGAWVVLRDPRFDYRLAAVGALVPDILDAPLGHRAYAHTLLFAVGLLGVIMGATVRRKSLRSRLLALPVGLLLHLVLHGVVGRSALLYWPFLGDWGRLPLVARPGVLLVQEAIGLAFAARIWSQFGLADAARRAVFLRTGRLDPC